jgi:hypothetical protein
MTEAEWFSCTDPVMLLESLGERTSQRKLVLFSCACCRHFWNLLPDVSRNCVQTAELFAEGTGERAELEAALLASQQASDNVGNGPFAPYGRAWRGAQAVVYMIAPLVGIPQREDCIRAAIVVEAGCYIALSNEAQTMLQYASEAARQCALAIAFSLEGTQRSRFHFRYEDTSQDERECAHRSARDIFGNPFRPILLHPTWRSNNVLALAQAIYDERAFDRLPILGDALEDAGCDNIDILNHCREPAEHVRGCWVVDLVLGKK